jgi:MYXO-CTERM domain-containing protein
MRKIWYSILMGTILVGFSSASQAVVFPNPNPAVYAPDNDGSGLFLYGQPTLSVELFDYGDAAALGTGLEFGFYFAGNPGTRITIFDSTDFTPNPLPNPPVQLAGINFATGRVGDLDAGVIQDTFTLIANTPIGFYLESPSLLGVPLFTQALLNPGGQDYSGAFRRLDSPFTYLISFALPSVGTISLNLVGPVSPVPIPGAAGLWLLGMAGLALFRRRLSRSAA